MLLEGDVPGKHAYLDFFVVRSENLAEVEATVARHPAVRDKVGTALVLPWGFADGIL
jgi:hypothetical protein